ncbi:hypothetical protein ARAM_003895 [Aspergillus rambellii]|uniref:Inner centromere protein ARK-binding domain-containing protein n=1 Tax=Aspergillus rambellii TaxID=308745 RepID=A0A0F8WQF3_9EURO|nr:hypothetical protein ARAM_003895 [Aspergillus rambellii]
MAAAGARAQKPVGSAAWISTEKENCGQLVDQEMEEIEFPVRYEMEWLNEHMAEVFSNNQFNFTDVFKTPGKLRGKTPRTLRKRDATESRVPLSEIFSSVQKNRAESRFSPSPAVYRSPTKAVIPPSAPTPPLKPTNITTKTSQPQPQYPDLSQNLNSFSQYNADSGYHGIPEDEDDDDDIVLTQVAPESQLSTQPLDLEPIPVDEAPRSSVDRRTTDTSFHSAHEEVRQRGETVEPMHIDSPEQSGEGCTPQPESRKESEPKRKSDTPRKTTPPSKQETLSKPDVDDNQDKDAKSSSPVKGSSAQPSSPHQEVAPEKDEMALDTLDDIDTPSDGFTPERPVIRKSSLSFASLPAREPLTTKSLGGSRLSRTSHVDIVKSNPSGGSNYFGRQTGGQRSTQAPVEENPTPAEKMDIDEIKDTSNADESDADTRASKLHNKSSTQRLHEKISMLGKLQPSRPTKSIPAVAGLSSAQVSYPELPAAKPEDKPDASASKSRETVTAEPPTNAEDDWIKPLNSPYQLNFPRSQAPESKPKVSVPSKNGVSDEPASSAPRSKAADDEAPRTEARQRSGTIRGKSSTPIFSSPRGYGHQKSASVHLDDTISTTPVGSPSRHVGPLSASKSRLQSIVRTAKGLFTSSGGVSAVARMEASSPEEPRVQLERATTDVSQSNHRPLSVFSPPRHEGRRTRSSTEKEERRKQQELEDRKREEELAEKARQQEKPRAMQQKTARERSHTESDARGQPVSLSTLTSPNRAPQAKPQMKELETPTENVIKAPSQPAASQAPSRLGNNRPTRPTREIQQKPKPQPVSIRVNTKPPTLKKKASNSSLHTAASNSSFKSSVSSQTQRKAQLASERKREQEEREARRKEEQRREIERKRAAQQQEEARRQEMRSRAEVERREKLAEDPKKAAQMQAIEKRRLENARRLERQGSQQPEAAPQSSQRSEMGNNRPASRLGSALGRPINQPQPNPAKPPKRGLDEEANNRPATAKPATIQSSGETKRRRTDDEQNRASMRPTMAPPIRQSTIRKEPTKLSIYGHAPHSAVPQASSSNFKTVSAQKPAHPMDMAKYASGKIPFAESSSAAAPSQSHRTPGASSSGKAPAKSSPHYPNGENIHLPEIATDSEDEDSDAEMLPVPKWAQPKQLEGLLRDQEGLEADSIFGPIAPFSLEETFKADKRVKKFRDRTSSANWSGPDGLTQEEIRRDIAERQRLRLNGGWTFGL